MKRFFDHLGTIDAVKAEYKRLAKIHHPDVGGDTATMQAINTQYTERINHLKRYGERRATVSPDDGRQQQRHTETPEEFIAIINAVIGLAGVDLDLVGCWIWATGNTYPHRDALKAAGFSWASKKRAWYWHPEDAACSSRGKKSLDEIKRKYGSERIFGTAPRAISA